MRLTRCLPFALVVAWASASPAMAVGHWQYAKWDMTAVELVAASNGEVQLYDPKPGDKRFDTTQLATGRFSQDGIEYDVRYLFADSSRRLVAIELAPDASRCDQAKTALAARLAEPIIDRREYSMGAQVAITLLHTWINPESGEKTVYRELGWRGEPPSNCAVTISPR